MTENTEIEFENNDFALTNKPTDNPTEFVEADPFNREAVAKIILWVDWQKKEATVETRYQSGSITFKEANGIATAFRLPEKVDATRFPEFYKESVQPVLQKLGKSFDIEWDGSNNKGFFTDDDDKEINYFWEVEEVLLDSSEHDKYIFFDVADSFQTYAEIIDFLAPGIDFMTADLSDMGIVRKIRDELEGGCVFLESDKEVQADLIRMQESLKEKEEE